MRQMEGLDSETTTTKQAGAYDGLGANDFDGDCVCNCYLLRGPVFPLIKEGEQEHDNTFAGV